MLNKTKRTRSNCIRTKNHKYVKKSAAKPTNYQLPTAERFRVFIQTHLQKIFVCFCEVKKKNQQQRGKTSAHACAVWTFIQDELHTWTTMRADWRRHYRTQPKSPHCKNESHNTPNAPHIYTLDMANLHLLRFSWAGTGISKYVTADVRTSLYIYPFSIKLRPYT